jgi:hypothetical protein
LMDNAQRSYVSLFAQDKLAETRAVGMSKSRWMKTVMIQNVSRLVYSPAPTQLQEMFR